ncbi:hypothetical protein L9F63_027021, partial [Diploptera punctata]
GINAHTWLKMLRDGFTFLVCYCSEDLFLICRGRLLSYNAHSFRFLVRCCRRLWPFVNDY